MDGKQVSMEKINYFNKGAWYAIQLLVETGHELVADDIVERLGFGKDYCFCLQNDSEYKGVNMDMFINGIYERETSGLIPVCIGFHKVGTIFNHKDHMTEMELMVVESRVCAGCVFEKDIYDCKNPCCHCNLRTDGKSVKYIMVNKIN